MSILTRCLKSRVTIKERIRLFNFKKFFITFTASYKQNINNNFFTLEPGIFNMYSHLALSPLAAAFTSSFKRI